MDDASLLERMLRGEELAFVEIVRRYNANLVRLARVYVGSDATAQDVVQETWIAVVRGIERFEGRSTFKTWLFRICVNRARSIATRERRTIPVDLTETGPTEDASRFNDSGMWTDPPIPFTEIIDSGDSNHAVIAAIRKAIGGLPAVGQAVVTLRDVEGLSTTEVSDLLGLTEGNVRVILHRGRARVRAAVEERMRGGWQ